MQRLELLVVSPDPNFYKDCLQDTLESGRFLVKTTKSVKEASKILANSNGKIAGVFFEITQDSESSPAESMQKLRTQYFPEVVLCVRTNKDDDKSFALPIIDYMRNGASHVLTLPTYSVEILWIAKKIVTTYLTRTRVVESLNHPEFKDRTREFFNLIFQRKKEGLPVSFNELKLFFSSKSKEVALHKILEAVKQPPVKDYKNTTILIVEDEQKAVDNYKNYLERNCFKVEVAMSGKDAMAAIKNLDTIHVALLDVQLGDTTGNKLISPIKEYHPQAQIIMITAFTEFDLIINTLKLGAFDYLVKGEMNMALVNQKIIEALHKQYFDEYMATYMKGANG